MNQKNILKKLQAYLELKNKVAPDPLLDSLIQDMAKGCCYGFSICWSAMQANQMLSYWQKCLMVVLKWDETPESLDELVALPKSKALLCRKKVFDKVINYVTFLQSPHLFLSDVTFSDVLNPELKLFAFINSNDQISYIQDRNFIAGHFSNNALAVILDKLKFQISGNICLVINKYHAISISYHSYDKSWNLYDPSTRSTEEFSEDFYDIRKLIEKIFIIQGQDLKIEIASIKKTPLNLEIYDAMIADDKMLEDLLKAGGLERIYSAGYATFAKVLAAIDKHVNGENILYNALNQPVDQKEPLLQRIAYKMPEILPLVLNIIARRPDAGEKLYNMLAQKNSTGISNFIVIAKYAPDCFKQILAIISESPQGASLLPNLLKKRYAKNLDGSGLLTKYAPQLLPEIFQIIELHGPKGMTTINAHSLFSHKVNQKEFSDLGNTGNNRPLRKIQ